MKIFKIQHSRRFKNRFFAITTLEILNDE